MVSHHYSRTALGPIATATFIAVHLLPVPAVAQESDESFEAEAVEEIVVTGSRIKRRNLVSTSPVTQVDAVELEFQGITRVEDMLNDLPQVIADQSSATNNGSAGIATVDLRGLQPIRTLTLLNGRRLPLGSPFNPAADVNQIPGMMIERVEVLTGVELSVQYQQDDDHKDCQQPVLDHPQMQEGDEPTGFNGSPA